MNRYGIWPPMPMATPGLPSFHAVMNDGPSWASNNNMGWDGVRSTVDAVAAGPYCTTPATKDAARHWSPLPTYVP